MYMCRESRKIFDMLNQMAASHNIQGFNTPGHIYICDRLVLQFYTQPMMNFMKSKISRQKHYEWKYFTIEYWENALINAFKDNGSVRRECGAIGGDNQEGFSIINGMLIADYSLADAYMYNNVVNQYNAAMIQKACRVATDANVHEIRYISAVLDKENAKKQLRAEKVERLGNKINQSTNQILNKPLITHTPLELVQMQYEWQQKQQNAELEHKYAEKFGDK